MRSIQFTHPNLYNFFNNNDSSFLQANVNSLNDYYFFDHYPAHTCIELAVILKKEQHLAILLANRSDLAIANDNFALEIALKNNDTASIKLLLSEINVFLYTEQDNNNNHIILPFIADIFAELSEQLITTPLASIVLPRNHALLYFYMIRHLIGVNNATYNNYIQAFLSLPAVRDLASMPVTPDEPNELLCLALSVNNQAAIDVLVAIPNVIKQAVAHNFYLPATAAFAQLLYYINDNNIGAIQQILIRLKQLALILQPQSEVPENAIKDIINTDLAYAVNKAISLGRDQVVELMLNANVHYDYLIKPNKPYCISIMENAVIRGHLAIVKLLVAAGVDSMFYHQPNKSKTKSVLATAIVYDRIDIIDYLLSKDVHLNKTVANEALVAALERFTPQHQAKYASIIKTLFDCDVGLNLNMKKDLFFNRIKTFNLEGIHLIGLKINHVLVTRDLFHRYGINSEKALLTSTDLANLPDATRRAILTERLTKKIHELGSTFDAQGYYDTRSLWIAARAGDIDIVQARLNLGIDPNKQKYGQFPIEIAVESGHFAVVKLLANHPKTNKQALRAALNIADNTQQIFITHYLQKLLQQDKPIHQYSLTLSGLFRIKNLKGKSVLDEASTIEIDAAVDRIHG